MRRFLLPLLLCLLLTVSCQSGGDVSYSAKERQKALLTLSEDILSNLSRDAHLSAEDLSSALSPVHTAYAEYVPLYQEISASYLEELAVILDPLVLEAVPILAEAAEEVIKAPPEEVFLADSGLTSQVGSICRRELVSFYRERLSGMEAELSSAYSTPEREFLLIRASYLNLSRVGGRFYLPYPKPCGLDDIAEAMASFLLERIAEEESRLKNLPPESADSPYMVFWSYA